MTRARRRWRSLVLGAVGLSIGVVAWGALSAHLPTPLMRTAPLPHDREAHASDAAGEASYRRARMLRDRGARHAWAGRSEASRRALERGIVEAERAVGQRPSSSRYTTLLADLHGQLASQSGVVGRMRHGGRATRLYARALELDPENALAHVGLGIAKLETPAMFGGSVPEALRGFRRAQALDPRCDEAWTWQAIALRRQGDVAGARRALHRALAIDPDSAHARRELEALGEDFE